MKTLFSERMEDQNTASQIILVADDDIVVLKTLGQRLKLAGYQVVIAENGFEAVAKFRETFPDLVLLDSRMPVMDGITACKEIKSFPEGKDVPIIIVTAVDDAEHIHRAFDAGAEEFVSKPVRWVVLHRRIQLLLKQRRRHLIRNQRNEQVRIFMNTTPVAVAMFDNNMRYLHVSNRWLEDHGLVNVTVLGRTRHELQPDEPEHWKLIDQRCLKGFWERHDSDLVVQADGSIRWYRWETIPWKGSDGHIEGVIMFKEDITRTKEMENEIKYHHDQMAVEREFIEEIIDRMRNSGECDFKYLRVIQSPVEKTTGDIVLSAFRPDGSQHVMLGDFAGHGLCAAIGGPMVSDIFYAMTRKGLGMEKFLAEINEKLFRKTPASMFMAAVFIEVSPDRRSLKIWNCSIPDILVFSNGRLIRRVESGFLARGIVANPGDDQGSVLVVNSGDRVYLYTDGFVEQRDEAGVMFGQDQLERVIELMMQHDDSLDLVQMSAFGYRSGGLQNDDMTMVEITC